MKAPRRLSSASSNIKNHSGNRIFRRESVTTISNGARSSNKWQPVRRPLSGQNSNSARKFSRSSLTSSRRRTPRCNLIFGCQFYSISVNLSHTLSRFRERLVELLFHIQLKILDFILEPADRLFPNEVNIRQLVRECTSSCCRKEIPTNRSQSATLLTLKHRHHQTYSMARRTVSES